MTIFKDRMHEAGFDRLRFDATAFARNFMNSGGTLDLWNEIGAAAASEMAEKDQSCVVQTDLTAGVDLRRQSGEQDQSTIVSNDQVLVVQPSHPKPSEGHAVRATNGPNSAADARPPMPGEDHGPRVQQDQAWSVPAGQPIASRSAKNALPDKAIPQVPPAREPSASQLSAAGEARRAAARSILYVYKTSTGQFWGDVHPYEVGSMMRDSMRGMALLSACGPLNPRQMKMTFAQLLQPEQAKIAMEKADKEAVNVA